MRPFYCYSDKDIFLRYLFLTHMWLLITPFTGIMFSFDDAFTDPGIVYEILWSSYDAFYSLILHVFRLFHII